MKEDKLQLVSTLHPQQEALVGTLGCLQLVVCRSLRLLEFED